MSCVNYHHPGQPGFCYGRAIAKRSVRCVAVDWTTCRKSVLADSWNVLTAAHLSINAASKLAASMSASATH